MHLLVRFIVSSLPLIAMPALAAQSEFVTGITRIRPAAFIFAVAGAMLLTLIFRTTASHVAQLVTARIGAFRIRRALDQRSPDVLHDFILPGAYGGLKKIDHAMLTAGGILCIQTKHYNGIIFGAADEPQWTNVDGVTKRRFLNPIIQNESRTRALQKVVADAPVANLVVFTGSVEFPTPPPNNVIHVRELESYIAKFVFGPSKIDDWDAVWLTLRSAALTDDATRRDLQAQIA